MTQQLFSVTEQQPFATQLGFLAHSALIDNLTGSWLYDVTSGRFIPPYTYGAITSLPGTQAPKLAWNTPTGIAVPPAGNNAAQVTYTDAVLPPNNGVIVYTPPASGQTLTVDSIDDRGIAAGANGNNYAASASKATTIYWISWAVVTAPVTGIYRAIMRLVKIPLHPIDQITEQVVIPAGTSAAISSPRSLLNFGGGFQTLQGLNIGGIFIAADAGNASTMDFFGSIAYTLT